MWTHVDALAVNPLPLELSHPGASLLAFTGMEVCVEHRKVRAVIVKYLISLDIRMVHRYVLVLLERNSVQSVGKSEHALDDVRQFEIRAQHLCIEVEFLELQLV